MLETFNSPAFGWKCVHIPSGIELPALSFASDDVAVLTKLAIFLANNNCEAGVALTEQLIKRGLNV